LGWPFVGGWRMPGPWLKRPECLDLRPDPRKRDGAVIQGEHRRWFVLGEKDLEAHRAIGGTRGRDRAEAPAHALLHAVASRGAVVHEPLEHGEASILVGRAGRVDVQGEVGKGLLQKTPETRGGGIGTDVDALPATRIL